jgi:HPt (histidine-containing phosphotransfer) domain-containing protein
MTRAGVLILDRDAGFRRRARDWLASLEVAVHEADSPGAAREVLGRNPVSIALIGGESEAVESMRSVAPELSILALVEDEAASFPAHLRLAGVLPRSVDSARLVDAVRRLMPAPPAGDASEDLDFEAAFAALRADYLRALPQDVEALSAIVARAAAAPDDLDAATQSRQIAHRITGTAASYELAEISAEARQIESVFVRRVKGMALTTELLAQALEALQRLRRLVGLEASE